MKPLTSIRILGNLQQAIFISLCSTCSSHDDLRGTNGQIQSKTSDQIVGVFHRETGKEDSEEKRRETERNYLQQRSAGSNDFVAISFAC